MQSSIDIAIIGAGAAGVGAARRLRGSGVSNLLIEAGPEIGGRARTIRAGEGPLDVGCGWLHSAERNPWAGLAQQSGLTLDRRKPAWRAQYRDLGFPPEAQRAARRAFEEFVERLRSFPPRSDRAADALEPGAPWNEYIDALSGFMNGAELAELSATDFMNYENAAGVENWRIEEGFGTAIGLAAHDHRVQLSTMVTRVDHSNRWIAVETGRGTIRTRAVIVTVSTNVLAQGRLRFDPPLPDKMEAAASLPLGTAEKLFLGVRDPNDLEPDTHLIGNPRRSETGSYYLRPLGLPVIECFFGGSGARMIAREGSGAMVGLATDELAALFGEGLRGRLYPIASSAWATSPEIGGSYSHALPGHSLARQRLAEAVDERLFFAGEACSANDFSTAHGAFETGWQAAEDALAALPRLGV